MSRSILHVDMDAYYASVEIRDDPTLRGKPVVVGGSPEGRGVVAAASYEVRSYGVHSAMPARTAIRLCPQVVFVRPRHDYYAEISRHIREIFRRYTPMIEPLSLDEAFLDVTGSQRLWGTGPHIARSIKDQIRTELELVASVGVAPNKFLAKLASDLEKPDGLVVVDPERVQAFLDDLPVARLWGVGKSGQARLAALGISRIGDLRRRTDEELERRFGTWGRHIRELAHGRDDRPVVSDGEAKSISHETTFANDIDDLKVLRGVLLELTEQVARRLRQCARRARTVEIKVRYADFRTITRSRSLGSATDATTSLWRAADELLGTALGGRFRIRLLGMGVSGLIAGTERQLSLFEAPDAKGRTIDRVADRIKDRFGDRAVHRGSARRPSES